MRFRGSSEEINRVAGLFSYFVTFCSQFAVLLAVVVSTAPSYKNKNEIEARLLQTYRSNVIEMIVCPRMFDDIWTYCKQNGGLRRLTKRL